MATTARPSRVREVSDFAKQTVNCWLEHNAFRLAASLAYYTVFSLGPLLLLATAIAGIFFGPQAAAGELAGQLRGALGKQGAEAVQQLLAGMNHNGGNVTASVVGLVVLLFGATGVFAELKASLNQIWETEPKKTSGVWAFIHDRLLSFAMVLAIGFLLLVSLVLSTVLAAAGQTISNLVHLPEIFFQGINFLASFGVVTLLFAMIYKVLPEADVRWRDVWVGAVVTSMLFTIGKTLIGFYLGRSSTTSPYGASGSLVVILLWAYYSSLILFLGAEFTHVFAKRYGSKLHGESKQSPRAA